MSKSKLQLTLEDLPVFKEAPEKLTFRDNPIRIFEFGFITQNTSPGIACYPFKMQDLAAVIGRTPDSKRIYFCHETLKDKKGHIIVGPDTIYSMGVDQIESYELWKRL